MKIQKMHNGAWDAKSILARSLSKVGTGTKIYNYSELCLHNTI